MEKFIYAVWFRDTNMLPDEEDYEWVACIAIEAANMKEAQEWGDHLSKNMTTRNSNEIFLWSEVGKPEDPLYVGTDVSRLPSIKYGEEASDKFIGW